jgi:hypothetical protein
MQALAELIYVWGMGASGHRHSDGSRRPLGPLPNRVLERQAPKTLQANGAASDAPNVVADKAA